MKEEDSSIVCISFFIIMAELMDVEDSLWLAIMDPDVAGMKTVQLVNIIALLLLCEYVLT